MIADLLRHADAGSDESIVVKEIPVRFPEEKREAERRKRFGDCPALLAM